MRCDEIKERFVDLLYDERGTQPASPELKGHIDSCPSCRVELERLQSASAAMKRWKEEPLLRPALIPHAGNAAGRVHAGPWRWIWRAAVAAAAVLALLALGNAEVTWNRDGFTFKTHLLGGGAPGGDYYTKAELREVLKRVLDDSETRMMETNYLMMQKVMDALEQERSSDLYYIRSLRDRNRAKN